LFNAAEANIIAGGWMEIKVKSNKKKSVTLNGRKTKRSTISQVSKKSINKFLAAESSWDKAIKRRRWNAMNANKFAEEKESMLELWLGGGKRSVALVLDPIDEPSEIVSEASCYQSIDEGRSSMKNSSESIKIRVKIESIDNVRWQWLNR
jgi:hypothetical protein